ncbi:MAG: hypothetical protein JKY94_07415 [Rhodobacteraceae bacterium]|nr:hypothetical protein [Paracoccaceae bacterium]
MSRNPKSGLPAPPTAFLCSSGGTHRLYQINAAKLDDIAGPDDAQSG